MRIRKKPLLYLIIPILAFATLYITVGLAAYLPPAIGQPLWKFGYQYLTLAPSNGEPYGVYIQRPSSPADRLNIALYDGQERHYFTKPAGDDHRHAALQPFFHLRVNAPNDMEAARFLRQFFSERGFHGVIGEATVFAHGSPASPRLGLTKIKTDLFSVLSEYRSAEEYGNLTFVSCEVAQGEEGKRYIQQVADTYGFRVIADEKKVQWYFFLKWFHSLEGEANYEIDKEDWWVATPLQGVPKRLSELVIR